jgi:PAS domain S-box-containing protein
LSPESNAEVEALRARVRELEALCEGIAPPGMPPLPVLLQNAPDSITVMDRGCLLRYLNRTFAPLTLADVVGTSALDYLEPEYKAPFQQAFERAWQEGEVQYVEAKTRGGFVWETRLVPLGAPGEVYAVMGIGADVTQRRVAEQALQEARKLEAIGRITADLAHNFNNLLLVMLTNLGLCKAAAGAELQPRLVDAENAAQLAADLVRKLMLLARRKTKPKQLAPARLEEIAARTVEMCRAALDGHGQIAITLRVEGELAPVHVDTGEVEQALLNVLLNARDALHSHEAPAIEVVLDMAHMPQVDTGPLKPAVRVRVRDNGPGMSETVRSRVFEPFFTTKDQRGTGLGLATAYAAMIDHDGLILCDSSPGAGTTFTLLFPAG